MEDKIWKFTLRIDKTQFRKLQYVAEYNGRSANREIEHYIRRVITAFEKEHGEIPVEPEKSLEAK